MSSLTWPAGVIVVALCSLLALALSIAYVSSATTLRCARTNSLKSIGQRSTVTDARDPPRKETASLLARPANVPLSALYSFRRSRFPSHAHLAKRLVLRRRLVDGLQIIVDTVRALCNFFKQLCLKQAPHLLRLGPGIYMALHYVLKLIQLQPKNVM